MNTTQNLDTTPDTVFSWSAIIGHIFYPLPYLIAVTFVLVILIALRICFYETPLPPSKTAPTTLDMARYLLRSLRKLKIYLKRRKKIEINRDLTAINPELWH